MTEQVRLHVTSVAAPDAIERARAILLRGLTRAAQVILTAEPVSELDDKAAGRP